MVCVRSPTANYSSDIGWIAAFNQFRDAAVPRPHAYNVTAALSRMQQESQRQPGLAPYRPIGFKLFNLFSCPCVMALGLVFSELDGRGRIVRPESLGNRKVEKGAQGSGATSMRPTW